MKAKAAVLEKFDEPLTIREFEVCPLQDGEVRIKIKAAGVCGSDVHMWRGKDPRTPLPLILGHEGIGEVAEIGGSKQDVFGTELRVGDLVMWDRGIMCGRCYYCVIKKQPSLCPTRKTYGISISCKEPPHFRGCYAEYLHLVASAHLLKISEDVDPAVLVPASCSGATSVHTMELCDVERGDTVVIIGPGPVGICTLMLALDRGPSQVFVIGTSADESRLKLCEEFGAAGTLMADKGTLEERIEYLKDHTHGIGANLVVECTGSARAAQEGLKLVAPCGTYAIPGIAVPVGELPVAFFEDIARKNVNLQGVWVSDMSHLLKAVDLFLSGKFPFAELVTHKFALEEATAAFEVIENREAIKAVLLP